MGPFLDMSYKGLESAEDPIPLFMTVEEYLGSSFQPDIDFVDGIVENRNVGELLHSLTLGEAMFLLGEREKEWGIEVLPTCRLRVSEQRIRVPDVMAISASGTREQIVTRVPIVCIEVISPDDTWRRLRMLFEDFWSMGVRNIWAFEPEERLAHWFDADGLHPVREAELRVPGTEIRLNVADVFRVLKRSEG
jgi:Uma2 family endonuclease